MAGNPKGSHRAYKEWAPSVKLLQQNINRIIHAKINGRAIVNLQVYYIIVLIIVRQKTAKGKKLIKKMKMKSKGNENK